MSSATLPIESRRPDEDGPATVPIDMQSKVLAGQGFTPPGLAPPERNFNLYRGNTSETMEADVLTPSHRVSVRLLSAAAVVGAISPAAKRLLAEGKGVTTQAAPVMPVGAQPRLRVVRGQRLNSEYPLFEGTNFLGRRDDEPIDIDLEDQEPADRVWTSRKHAVVYYHDRVLQIEDLNSLNGTFVNRTRVPPGQPQVLATGDVIQVGTIQLRVVS